MTEAGLSQNLQGRNNRRTGIVTRNANGGFVGVRRDGDKTSSTKYAQEYWEKIDDLEQ